MRPEYSVRRREICRIMGWGEGEGGVREGVNGAFDRGISVMYAGGKSCNEISADIEEKSGGMIVISARSIERALKKAGVRVRSVAEAGRLSARRGRRAKK